MPWSDYPLRTLTLPADAGPNDAQIVIGADIPAELVTYYAPLVVRTGTLYRTDADTYSYDVLITSGGLSYRAIGSADAGVVDEIFRMLDASPGQLTYGAHDAAHTPSVAFTNLARLFIESGAGFNIDGQPAPRGQQGAGYAVAGGTPAASVGAEVAVPAASWATEPSITIPNQKLWAVTVQMLPSSTDNGANFGLIKVRKGSASVVGTVLGNCYIQYPAGFGNFGRSQTWVFLIKNTSGSTVTTKLSLTIQLTAGVQLNLYGGDATSPMFISAFDLTDQGFDVLGAMAISV